MKWLRKIALMSIIAMSVFVIYNNMTSPPAPSGASISGEVVYSNASFEFVDESK